MPEACRSLAVESPLDVVSEVSVWEGSMMLTGAAIDVVGRRIGLGPFLIEHDLASTVAEGAARVDPILGLVATSLVSSDVIIGGESQDDARERLVRWSERSPGGLGSQIALVFAHVDRSEAGRADGGARLVADAHRISHPVLQRMVLATEGPSTPLRHRTIEALPLQDPELVACRDAWLGAR